MPIDNVRWIDLPTISGDGILTFAEKGNPLPFLPQRVYYLYKIPQETTRGAHAHKELQQAIIAIHGSFTLLLNDGRTKKEFVMNDPSKAIYVPRMLWRELYAFTPDAVCLVLASLPYSEDDYIRNYQDFLAACNLK